MTTLIAKDVHKMDGFGTLDERRFILQFRQSAIKSGSIATQNNHHLDQR